MTKGATIRFFASAIAVSAIISAEPARAAPSQETLKQLAVKCFTTESRWSSPSTEYKNDSVKIRFGYQSHDQDEADAANGILKRLHYYSSILEKINGGDWEKAERGYVVVINRHSWEFSVDGADGYPTKYCHYTFTN